MRRFAHRIPRAALAALMALSLATAPAADGGEIRRSRDLLRGNQADGREGDLRLANEEMTFIFSALDHPLHREVTGGALIDLALTASRLDRLGELRPYHGPTLSRSVRNTAIGLSDDGEAVVVEGVDPEAPGITLRTEYRLDPAMGGLRIMTELTNGTDDALENWAIGDFVRWGSATPFVMNRGILFVPGGHFESPSVIATGHDFGMAVTPDGPATMEIIVHPQHTRLIHTREDIAPGETVICTRHLAVGLESMATVADAIWAARGVETGTFRGSVVEQVTGAPIPDAEVLVSERSISWTSPLLRVLTDEEGNFVVSLPAGARIIAFPRAFGRTRPSQTVPPLVLEAGEEIYHQFQLSPPALLDLRVTDEETGELLPVRVALYDLDGKPAMLGPVESGEAAGPYIHAATGEGVYEVPRGRYRMCITRGLEYERYQHSVVFESGIRRQIHISLSRLFDTPGYVAADLGVLTDNTYDALVSPADRLRTAAAEGLEFLVATDVEHVTDLTAAGEEAEFDLPMTIARGERFLPPAGSDLGAWSVFPLPEETVGESVFDEMSFDSPRDLLASVRERFPEALITSLSPAREGVSPFMALGYTYNTVSRRFDLETEPNPADHDFDLVEVFGDRDLSHFREDLRMYHSLLREGHRFTAVGSANSHYGALEEIGYPRTYIAAEDSDPRAIDPEEVWESLRSGNALVTTGPWVEFSIQGNPMGSMMLWEAGDPIEVAVRVLSPRTSPLSHLEIHKGGDFVWRHSFLVAPAEPLAVWEPEGGVDRIMVRSDEIITVQVEGLTQIDLFNPHNVPIEPFIPWAVTNPIWIDTDGNWQYDHFSYDDFSN